MSKSLSIAVALSSVVFAGCGGGGSSTATPASAAPPTEAAQLSVVANAGQPQSVVAGVPVTLDGSTSVSNGSVLTYAWTLTTTPLGSKAVLSDKTSPKPTLTVDLPGVYTASLVVENGVSKSVPSVVTITAANANAAPVASAGTPQNVVAPALVTLDASGSTDANNDPLTFVWTFTSKPAGSSATFSSASAAKPTFTADVPGNYVASVTANDGRADSTPAIVAITATAGNAAPVANAGKAQTVREGFLTSLDGTLSSDANNDPLTYTWTLTTRPLGSLASLSLPTTARPTFQTDIAGVYIATLVANDGKINSSPATVAITAAVGKYLRVSYPARNGLNISLDTFVVRDMGNGYISYDFDYTQTNTTSLAIDEATFKLYFSNDVSIPQYGSFGRVYPGSPVSRHYQYTALKTSIPSVLEYDQDGFFSTAPIQGSAQWTVPIPTNLVYEGGLKWTQVVPQSYLPWDYANTTYCPGGNFNNEAGWRLPTQAEVTALAATGAISGHSWSQTTVFTSTSSGTAMHYQVNALTGVAQSASDSSGYATCVK